MSHSIFVYGTLMSPSVLRRVIYGPDLPDSTTRTLPASLNFMPALLSGYQRHRVIGVDYPGIIPIPKSTVRGSLVTGLTDGDMYRLDIFEGDEYARQKVRVQTINDCLELDDPREAETYVWIAPRARLADDEWDYDEFVREKMWRWAGTAAETEGEFGEVDEAAKGDPTGGRGANGAISKVLEDEKAKEEVLEARFSG